MFSETYSAKFVSTLKYHSIHEDQKTKDNFILKIILLFLVAIPIVFFLSLEITFKQEVNSFCSNGTKIP
jgi:hypothetical protein